MSFDLEYINNLTQLPQHSYYKSIRNKKSQIHKLERSFFTSNKEHYKFRVHYIITNTQSLSCPIRCGTFQDTLLVQHSSIFITLKMKEPVKMYTSFSLVFSVSKIF